MNQPHHTAMVIKVSAYPLALRDSTSPRKLRNFLSIPAHVSGAQSASLVAPQRPPQHVSSAQGAYAVLSPGSLHCGPRGLSTSYTPGSPTLGAG